MNFRLIFTLLFVFSVSSNANEDGQSYLKRFSDFVALNNMGIRLEPTEDLEGELVKRMSSDQQEPDEIVPLEEDSGQPSKANIHAFKIINDTANPADLFFTFFEPEDENQSFKVFLNVGVPLNALGARQVPGSAAELVGLTEVSETLKGLNKVLDGLDFELIEAYGGTHEAPIVYLPKVSNGHVSLPLKLKSSLTSDQIEVFITALAAYNFRPEPKPLSPEQEQMRLFLSSGVLENMNIERNDKDAAHLWQMPWNTVMHFKSVIENDPFLRAVFPTQQMQYDLAEALANNILSDTRPPIEDVVLEFEERMISEGRLPRSRILELTKAAQGGANSRNSLVAGAVTSSTSQSGLVSISFKELLESVGFGPMVFNSVPIENRDDLNAAGLGVPNKVVRQGMWFWPFNAFSSSSDLSQVAMTLDKRAFTGTEDSEAKVMVAMITDSGAAELRYTLDFSNQYERAFAKDVRFITSDVLRVQVLHGSSQKRLAGSDQTYYVDYVFITDNGREQFSLMSELSDLNPVNVKGYRDDTYIIEIRAEGDEESSYKVIKYNPVTKERITLIESLEQKIGKALFHGVVDLQGRDVWQLGEDHLHVKFSVYSDSAKEWESLALNVVNGEASIGPSFYPYPTPNRLIEGSKNYVLDVEDGVLGVRSITGEVTKYLGRDMKHVSIVGHSEGFVAIEANMTEYRHFLLDLEGNYTEVLRDRLITADYHDGGFIGFGGEVRSGGDITLHRYIYNEDNLSAQALRQDERFNDEYAQSLDGLSCQSLLE